MTAPSVPQTPRLRPPTFADMDALAESLAYAVEGGADVLETTHQTLHRLLMDTIWNGIARRDAYRIKEAHQGERCRRCGQRAELLGVICGSCADDLRGDRDAIRIREAHRA